MQSQQNIHLFDFKRLMIGQTPATFLIEVAFRAIVTYVLLLVATRLMGKRVAGQLSVMEMTVLITLGAAIGVPLQAPERGLLAAVVILVVAICYQWGLNLWAFRSRRAELLMQGDVTILIRDGCMDLPEMKRQALSHERLYSALRQAGIIHLGQVKRCYLEADGHFSIYRSQEPPPGLCLMPEQDVAMYVSQFRTDNRYACRNCGRIAEGTGPKQEGDAAERDEKPQPSSDEPRDAGDAHHGGEPGDCPTCGKRVWSPAVQSTKVGDMHPEKQEGGSKPGPMGREADAKSAS